MKRDMQGGHAGSKACSGRRLVGQRWLAVPWHPGAGFRELLQAESIDLNQCVKRSSRLRLTQAGRGFWRTDRVEPWCRPAQLRCAGRTQYVATGGSQERAFRSHSVVTAGSGRRWGKKAGRFGIEPLAVPGKTPRCEGVARTFVGSCPREACLSAEMASECVSALLVGLNLVCTQHREKPWLLSGSWGRHASGLQPSPRRNQILVGTELLGTSACCGWLCG